MAGLDMVKGPHWSQILSLFGPNGTISDILKDRTQVQLKDKARNLKLFFLKTSSEMPYYLQSVTGELKTRAPSQAARKEAEEKARVNSEEEQARLQGIMTLASGLQNNHPSARSPMPMASPIHARSMTPHAGMAALAGSPVSHGPANIAPAPAPVSGSPDIKSEPVDHHNLAHNLPQNGLSAQHMLAQMHSGIKQEGHGQPQIQPRVPAPHAPPAAQPQMHPQYQAAKAVSQPAPPASSSQSSASMHPPIPTSATPDTTSTFQPGTATSPAPASTHHRGACSDRSPGAEQSSCTVSDAG